MRVKRARQLLVPVYLVTKECMYCKKQAPTPILVVQGKAFRRPLYRAWPHSTPSPALPGHRKSL